jgi:hypothetical protein
MNDHIEKRRSIRQWLASKRLAEYYQAFRIATGSEQGAWAVVKAIHYVAARTNLTIWHIAPVARDRILEGCPVDRLQAMLERRFCNR